MKQVKTVLDPEIEARGFEKILSRVEVRLVDGRTLTRNSPPYKGGPENPLSDEELYEKFRSCATIVLSQEKVTQAHDLLNHAEEIRDIRTLLSALSPDSSTG